MSITDAVRARALEARVADLEKRLETLEQGGGGSNSHLAQRINLLQGQINQVRRGMNTDDAA